jgi:hypothetical protein
MSASTGADGGTVGSLLGVGELKVSAPQERETDTSQELIFEEATIKAANNAASAGRQQLTGCRTVAHAYIAYLLANDIAPGTAKASKRSSAENAKLQAFWVGLVDELSPQAAIDWADVQSTLRRYVRDFAAVIDLSGGEDWLADSIKSPRVLKAAATALRGGHLDIERLRINADGGTITPKLLGESMRELADVPKSSEPKSSEPKSSEGGDDESTEAATEAATEAPAPTLAEMLAKMTDAEVAAAIVEIRSKASAREIAKAITAATAPKAKAKA